MSESDEHMAGGIARMPFRDICLDAGPKSVVNARTRRVLRPECGSAPMKF